MRADSFGFFWNDIPPPKEPKKEKEKKQPPEATWLRPDYLPKYEEASVYTAPEATEEELLQAYVDRTPFMFDIECYPNYFLISFMSFATGNCVVLEATEHKELDVKKLRWMLEHILIVGFYSAKYDIIIANIAAAGATMMQLYQATDELIVQNTWETALYKKYNAKKIKSDHIDIIEVAPLSATLKIYAGRQHVERMQDLPFPPGTWLSEAQIACVRYYNIKSDLPATAHLYATLTPHLTMRAEMSNRYRVDLRSKSDAQIAEAVIRNEYRRKTGCRPGSPRITEGLTFKYQVPDFISYQHPELQTMLARLREVDFVVQENGKVGLPPIISDNYINIGNSSFKMGIGGLHSREKSVSYRSNDKYRIVDRDVASYYPRLILNQRIYPPALGEVFLPIYEGIVKERLQYKKNKVVVWANGLKIVINGTFGKLFDPHSIMYFPQGGIQVTVTGQLSLLMLIDWLWYANIEVISANTDGIVCLIPRDKETLFNEIITAWEKRTNFETEETEYLALYSRDVNNYIAVKTDGTTKNKGAFANPWLLAKDPAEKLHKNPVNTICIEAVCEYLTKGIPLEQTIMSCQDIRKFVTVRTANAGGAVKLWTDRDAEYLGKSLRWYYSTAAEGDMVYAKNGNSIPDSSGARPCGDLPLVFPNDVNYSIYVDKAKGMLEKLAAPF